MFTLTVRILDKEIEKVSAELKRPEFISPSERELLEDRLQELRGELFSARLFNEVFNQAYINNLKSNDNGKTS
jgi:hypothetical protein